MSLGATDGRYLRNANIATYGHSGLASDMFDVRAHGKDERVSVKAFEVEQQYLYELVKLLAGGKWRDNGRAGRQPVEVEVLELLLATAGIGALFGWPSIERMRYERRYKAFLRTLGPSVEIALGVAMHEAKARRQPLSPIHLLYGLLQDEAVVGAIARLGGNAEAIEASVHVALDRAVIGDGREPPETTVVLMRASLVAQQHHRRASAADLWRFLMETDAAKLVDAGNVSPIALLFVLTHGLMEPAPVMDAPYVHVVLRNDDYTTFQLVYEILSEVFELAAPDATAKMHAAHAEGRAIVGRFATSVAKDKIEAARVRARATGSPLWLGVEAC